MQKIFSNNNQFGVLLLNVLVSFGIIALIATVSLPFVRKYQPTLQLNAAARNLTSDLRLAQQLTISEQISYIVELDDINDLYKILKIDTSTSTIKTVEFEDGINFQSIASVLEKRVEFNFYGGVVNSGEIILANEEEDSATISVKPSGYVQLLN